jgi:hypothetical protein
MTDLSRLGVPYYTLEYDFVLAEGTPTYPTPLSSNAETKVSHDLKGKWQ